MTDRPEPVRHRYAEELEQLRMQVELMGVRVDENLERMRQVLETGDTTMARLALEADDEVDAMNVSLIEKCYVLLARESPMATDLRLIVSVVKVLNELERVGDLALRVVKASAEEAGLRDDPRVHDVLLVLADEAIERFRMSLQAWATLDMVLATEVAEGSARIESLAGQLMSSLLALTGPDAVRIAMRAYSIGRALDRVADHGAIIGARVRYLVSGEARYLAAEVR